MAKVEGIAGEESSLEADELRSIVKVLLEVGQSDGELNERTLSEQRILRLCGVAGAVLLKKETLVELSAPLVVVGDIHGQYSDLLRWFNLAGFPPQCQFLFLGDYVDRGRRSIEVVCLLLAYLCLFPDHVHLLRGNHESTPVNRVFGFYTECQSRYSVRLWRTFQQVFDCLPLAALIDGRILCMHGGLSPDLDKLDDIRRISRPLDPPDAGLVCDLLWADPAPDLGDGFEPGYRGVSYQFGAGVVTRLCRRLNVDLVCRAHEVVEDGYEFFSDRHLVTVFSAPHYCGSFDNQAAVMTVAKDLVCSFLILDIDTDSK